MIELALDEDAVIDRLLKDFDRTAEIVRHPKFKALAAAVMAKIGGNPPPPSRESEIRLIGLASENEELRARIVELEATSNPNTKHINSANVRYGKAAGFPGLFGADWRRGVDV